MSLISSINLPTPLSPLQRGLIGRLERVGEANDGPAFRVVRLALAATGVGFEGYTLDDPIPWPDLVCHDLVPASADDARRALAMLPEHPCLSAHDRMAAARACAALQRAAVAIPSIEDLMADVTPDTLHGEIDWGPPRGREVW